MQSRYAYRDRVSEVMHKAAAKLWEAYITKCTSNWRTHRNAALLKRTDPLNRL